MLIIKEIKATALLCLHTDIICGRKDNIRSSRVVIPGCEYEHSLS